MKLGFNQVPAGIPALSKTEKSRRKKAEDYPAEFFRVLAALQASSICKIPALSRQQAYNLRRQWYRWIQALRDGNELKEYEKTLTIVAIVREDGLFFSIEKSDQSHKRWKKVDVNRKMKGDYGQAY